MDGPLVRARLAHNLVPQRVRLLLVHLQSERVLLGWGPVPCTARGLRVIMCVFVYFLAHGRLIMQFAGLS